MGTNYYLCNGINVYHIGKRAFRWKFLWDFSDSKFRFESKSALLSFLRLTDWEIRDEWNAIIAMDKFIELTTTGIGNHHINGDDFHNYLNIDGLDACTTAFS
jgi:hypothetical protein